MSFIRDWPSAAAAAAAAAPAAAAAASLTNAGEIVQRQTKWPITSGGFKWDGLTVSTLINGGWG